MNAGLAGCGSWGRNHGRVLASLGVLAAVADIAEARSRELAEMYQCRACAIDELLADRQIDAVVVALPPREQAQMALRVLSAGKHLFVEKPMAIDMGLARKIVSASRASGLVAMTGHLLLFHPAFGAIVELVAQGALGELRYIRAERCGQGRFYRDTDVAWDLLPHDLSLVQALISARPHRTTLARAAVVSELADVASLHMAYARGLLVECHVSRVATSRARRFLVHGSAASVLWDDTQDWSSKLSVIDNCAIGKPGSFSRPVPLVEEAPLTMLLSHFIDWIRHDKAPRSSVADGLEVLRTLADCEAVRPQQPTFTVVRAQARKGDQPALVSP